MRPAPRAHVLLVFAAIGAGAVWSCAKDGTGPTPVATTVSLDKTTLNFDAVGATEQLTATVRDQNGAVMSGASVSWTSNNTAAATVGGAGLVTAVANGSAMITATSGTASGSATASVAQVATAIVADSGDGQYASPGGTLEEQLVVRIADRLGAAVSGVSVSWAVTSGGGSVSPAGGTTDANGRARTQWTLGGGEGMQTAEAASAGLAGSPVAFTATASSVVISSVTPDTLVEGQSATITGSGFDPAPGNNTVTVDGVAAVVTGGTTTTLDFVVPAFDCQPARAVDVTVSRGGGTSNAASTPLHPAAFIGLGVGEYQVIRDPAQFCLQFRRSVTGGDAYMIGVGAAAEIPSGTQPFTLAGVTGFGPAGAPVAAVPRRAATSGAAQGRGWDPELAARWHAQFAAESRLREWERRHLDPAANPALRAASPLAAATAPPPIAGDTLHLHVPDLDGNACDSIPIDVEVRVVGSAGILATDVNNPTTGDSLTLVEIQAYSDTFDLHIYEVDTTYFGTPSDIDGNERVLIVLTIEVNRLQNGQIAGFVFSGDLVPPGQCASSDQGEIFYGHVPNPDATDDSKRTKAQVKAQMASLIAHEFTHNIQQSRRLVLSGDPFAVGLSRWEAEGQAVFAQEVVGHGVLGNQSYQNYDRTTAMQGAGLQWYEPNFRLLARYYGYRPEQSKVTTAPEDCTLFHTGSTTTSCDPFAFYGAAYALHRYVSDQYGPAYPGGEETLHRDWIDQSPTLNGVANVEALLDVEFDTVFAKWAAMQWVDDRVATADTTLELLSWDLFDIFSAYTSDDLRLIPEERSFTDFNVARTVRAGSTDYHRLSSVGPRGALAVAVRTGAGGVLPATLAPQLWLVRIQ